MPHDFLYSEHRGHGGVSNSDRRHNARQHALQHRDKRVAAFRKRRGQWSNLERLLKQWLQRVLATAFPIVLAWLLRRLLDRLAEGQGK